MIILLAFKRYLGRHHFLSTDGL